MNKSKILLDGNIEKEVDGIFYIYNSKYYFIYTEKEIDENGYVILHLVQIGKEIQNTPTGPVDTGFMIGVEVQSEEWKSVQTSITKIVNDKKNNTQDPEIQYLPATMLNTVKIMSKNTFRLLKNILVDDFNVNFDSIDNITNNIELSNTQNINSVSNDNVIIDYRSKYFEEEEKVKQLEETIKELNEKISAIKGILE